MPLTVAILSAEFPVHWQTYIVDQGSDFRALGTATRFLSTRAPAAGFMSADILRRAGGSVGYLFPPRMADVVYFLRFPRQLIAALAYLRGTRAGGLRSLLRRAALLPSVAALIREARAAGADIVLVHSFGDAAHLAAIAQRCTGLPYALTLHGPLSVWGGDIAAKVAGAQQVFAVTAALGRDVAEACPGVPVAVVSMGVDLDRFPFVDRPPRPVGAPLRVTTVARLHPSKGHFHALDAIARLRDDGLPVIWRIAGNGPHEAAIVARIGALGLAGSVSMLGPLSGEAVAALLAETDVLVLPSVGEGEAAPVSVMEAMASGVPAICSRIGGTPDMIEDGVDGFLVDQGDVAGLAVALRRLADDPALGAAMSRRARATAERLFDTRALSARTLALLRR